MQNEGIMAIHESGFYNVPTLLEENEEGTEFTGL